jgi:uncharacterized protein YgiM (DUF1202 family)
MKFCTSCGVELPGEVQFCGACGASVIVTEYAAPQTSLFPPPPPTPDSPSVVPASEYQAPTSSYGLEENDPPRSNVRVIVGGSVAAIAVLGLLYYFVFVRDDVISSDGGTPTAQTKPAEANVEAKQFYSVTQANIRDQATATSSTIIGKLPRGTVVSGRLILGVDGTSDWLELADGKGFVGAVNLSETQPPTLSKMLNDKIWTADKAVEIYTKPDASSTVIDRVAAGTKLTLVGLTGNDFIEIKLSKGGVGYLTNGSEIIEAAAVTNKPIAISFNPNTCNYGGEIEALFAQLAKQSQAKRAAIENAKYPDDDAREAALTAYDNKHETESRFMKLQRSYNGLTVTGIAQHYESQSLYFAEPVAKVIETLRIQGMQIGKDGQMPSTDVYAGVDALSKSETAYGRSSLSCGV